MPKTAIVPVPADPASKPTVLPAVPTRRQITVALRDLDIAPENLRYGEPADEVIPELAGTIKAAGLLTLPTVRPGRKTEAAFMVLDGRRRLLALRLLREAGEIDDDFAVEVFAETDKARQGAAVVLTNTAAPVHVADVIAAIGRMLRAKLTIAVIAQSLGYAELEIKRLAVLSTLPSVALEALKAGRMTLRQAKLLTRIKDGGEQAELARMALEGHGFQDWRITERLDEGSVTPRDPRCALVTAERYAAAGGRTEADLFDERPPILLDPEILTRIWLERAREIAAVLEEDDLAVHITTGAPPDLPEDLEPLGYVHTGCLAPDERTPYVEARDRFYEAVEAVEGTVLSENAVEVLLPMILAKRAQDQAGIGPRVVSAMVLSPSLRTGVEVRCFAPIVTESEQSDDRAETTPSMAGPRIYSPPLAQAPDPDIEGASHSLHSVRTDVATRGLMRALADDPGAALTALLARLFSALVVRTRAGRSDSALSITACAFDPVGGRVIDALDGEVRHRLDVRRAAWEASGQTVIAWIHDLAHGDKMALLAELTAVSLDVREARTTLIRSAARSEAAELADLCGADITLHWTPDEPYLQSHSKPQLLTLLTAMGSDDVRAAALRKTELVPWVAEQAASRTWAPANLSWAVSKVAIQPGDHDEDDGADGPNGDAWEHDDGTGAFAVTTAGEAALAQAAQ